MQDKSNKIQNRFMSVLGKIVEKHRKKFKKSVYMISAESFVPRSTWRDVEFGVSNNITLSNFCKIAEGLDMKPYELLKELSDKLGKDFSFSDLNN